MTLPNVPSAVLLDAAAPTTFVGLDGLGAGTTLDASAANAILGGRVQFDFASSTGWTLTNGSGGAAITGGVAQLTMPAGVASFDGGRASIVRDLGAITDPVSFRALVRLVSIANGDRNTQVGFFVSSSTVTNQLRFAVLPSGSVFVGYLGGAFTALGTIASAVAWDGTWWLEVVLTGSRCYARVGQGTSLAPPAASATSWRIVWSGDLYPYLSAGPPWDTIGLYLTTYGIGGGAITVDLDDVIVETV